MTELKLERKDQQPGGIIGGGSIMMTPALDENYWSYRVKLTERQAVIGFPKFGVVGIGFAVEAVDWNRNLSSGASAESIAEHIRINKGDDSIDDADVVAAVKLIQEAVLTDA